GSNVYPEFFSQLYQICHNIQLLRIEFRFFIPKELKGLISVQKNLKHLYVRQYDFSGDLDLESITNLLTKKHSDTLIKLELDEFYVPLSFIAKFQNLQELKMTYDYVEYGEPLNSFKELLHASFPHLQILKFRHVTYLDEVLEQFLEINGKSLKEFHTRDEGSSLSLAVAKFCPNLRKLNASWRYDELVTVFNSCRYLESIRVSTSEVKKLFEVVAKYSPKSFH